ncbi:BREX system ATP-binding domain-containing protein [Methanosarcina sp. Mfa9]|uniref:BREX system ATP-binding domain-containing protein n=1 Tax=Methanosarcina sp. Mfa9 TaxID=3439063 RepID=UPI003F83B002
MSKLSRRIFGGSSKAEAERKTKETGKAKERLKSSKPPEKVIDTVEALPLSLPEETSLLSSEGRRVEKISPPPRAALDIKTLSSISLPDSMDAPDLAKTPDSTKTSDPTEVSDLTKISDLTKTPALKKTPKATQTPAVPVIFDLLKVSNQLDKPEPEGVKEPAEEKAVLEVLAPVESPAPVKMDPIEISDILKIPELPEVTHTGELINQLEVPSNPASPNSGKTADLTDSQGAALEKSSPLDEILNLLKTPEPLEDERAPEGPVPNVSFSGEVPGPAQKTEPSATSTPAETSEAEINKDSTGISNLLATINSITSDEKQKYEQIGETEEDTETDKEISRASPEITTEPDIESAVSESAVSELVASEPLESESAVSELVVSEPTALEPVESEYVASKSSVSEPLESESAVSELVVSEPTALEPVESEYVASKSSVSEPLESESTVSELVVSEPTALEPVESEHVASKSAVPVTPMTSAGIGTETLLKSIAELTGEVNELPELESSELESPELETPELETPELETPELETPELETPELESSELESPELESSELESPELESPELETPELESSELESSELESSELESPVIEQNAAELKAEVPGPGNGNAPGEDVKPRIAARRIIEALRLGGVPLSCVEKYSVGREKEFLEACSWLDSGRGSLQVIGEYGSGKTHFLEMLSETALRKNWGVARIEIDAQETPFHKPHQLYESFVNNFCFRENGALRDFRAFLTLLNESESPEVEKISSHPYLGKMQEAWQEGKDREWLFEWIEGRREGPAGFPVLQKHQTAANLYSNLLNGLSWAAKHILGLEGVLILFDEAETVDPYWYTDYQFDKALNTLRGLVLLSNSDESLIDDTQDADILGKKSGLIYSKMTQQPVPYLWERESDLKLIFSFVPEMLESMEQFSKISSLFGSMGRIELETLDEPSLQTLLGNIEKIYSEAYGYSSEKNLYSYLPLDRPRNFVKAAVEGLDLMRYRPDSGSDERFK